MAQAPYQILSVSARWFSSWIMRTDGLTDTTSAICVPSMHFMQRTRNNYLQKWHILAVLSCTKFRVEWLARNTFRIQSYKSAGRDIKSVASQYDLHTKLRRQVSRPTDTPVVST
jgi:hypothetical protein